MRGFLCLRVVGFVVPLAGGGLYLLLNPDGSSWWRLKYRYGGKETLLALGACPGTGLKKARGKRDDARNLLKDGTDPNAHRKAEKAARADRDAGSFEVVAREWHAKQTETWAAGHAERVLRRIEAKGRIETAHRVKESMGAIFRYAVATHRATHDPSAALKGALATPANKSYAAITDPKQAGELLRAIRSYSGSDNSLGAPTAAACIRPTW